MPIVAVTTAGCGIRALTAMYGSILGLQKLRVLDCVSYLSGSSGTTWWGVILTMSFRTRLKQNPCFASFCISARVKGVHFAYILSLRVPGSPMTGLLCIIFWYRQRNLPLTKRRDFTGSVEILNLMQMNTFGYLPLDRNSIERWCRCLCGIPEQVIFDWPPWGLRFCSK